MIGIYSLPTLIVPITFLSWILRLWNYLTELSSLTFTVNRQLATHCTQRVHIPNPSSTESRTHNTRLSRNCSRVDDFHIQANSLRDHLLPRGYTRINLRKAFNRARARDRDSLLYPSPKPPQPNTVKLITKFSAHHQKLHSAISLHWHLLTDHHIIGKYVRDTPELVFRRATSLHDGLIHSHYDRNSQ